MTSVRANSVFHRLTTVPMHMQRYLQVFSNVTPITDATPIGISPVCDGYRHELRLVSEFWIDPTFPLAMQNQLRISKRFMIDQMYGDVLDQLAPIKRELCNGNPREAFRLVEELEKSILDQE